MFIDGVLVGYVCLRVVVVALPIKAFREPQLSVSSELCSVCLEERAPAGSIFGLSVVDEDVACLVRVGLVAIRALESLNLI